MPKRYDSSLQADTTVSQAQNAVNKLHYAVSQAMSHPTAQTIVQRSDVWHTRSRRCDKQSFHSEGEQC